MRHIHCKLLLAFAILLFTLSAYAAETRGVKRVKIKTQAGESVGLYEESHALVIGVSEYTNGWPKLPGVRKDVKAVTAALEKKGFNVTQVNNPKDRRAIEDAFTGFIDRYGLKPRNRLLFYFSGHGHTEKTTYGDEMGYIVPAASPNPKRDKQGFLKNAMDMQIIEVYAKRIQSKHALFVFDSCFSGALFALSRSVPESISYKTGKPVRQFITSGSADETVPDTSIFRQQFVSALEGEADLNKDHFVTGAELGEFLHESVINYSKGAQHPQYGKIRHPKMDKGDFVFQLSSLSLPKAPSESNFSINDLQEEVKKQQERKSREAELKREWAEKLKEMQAAFAEAKSLDSQQATPRAKVTAWKRFSKAFPEDNPYSSKDETLRDHSQARIAHWQAEEKKQKQQATLTVRSNVYDDEVYINGKLKGSTKLTVTLEPGTYRVELHKTGYKSVYTNITLKPGEQKTVKAELKRKTSQAALRQKQKSSGVWTEPNTGMKFRRIPGGSFRIGDQFGEGNDDEKNHRKITIKRFWLGTMEVTQAQWQAIMGNKPLKFKDDDLPVDTVNWNDVQEFIEHLNALTGKRFRLPSEAEWEYACREGGKKVRYCNGKDIADPSEMNFNGTRKYKKPYSVVGEYRRKITPVASFSPNSLGLYDMSGNVWEWTCSEYKNPYDGSEEKCSFSASRYSLRGGSSSNAPSWVRASNRNLYYPDVRINFTGFRLALDN